MVASLNLVLPPWSRAESVSRALALKGVAPGTHSTTTPKFTCVLEENPLATHGFLKDFCGQPLPKKTASGARTVLKTGPRALLEVRVRKL